MAKKKASLKDTIKDVWAAKPKPLPTYPASASPVKSRTQRKK